MLGALGERAKKGVEIRVIGAHDVVSKKGSASLTTKEVKETVEKAVSEVTTRSALAASNRTRRPSGPRARGPDQVVHGCAGRIWRNTGPVYLECPNHQSTE